MEEQEIWKRIPGFSDYEASTHGRFRGHRTANGRIIETPRIIQPGMKPETGTITISIKPDNGHSSRTRQAARTILLTFKGQPELPPGCKMFFAKYKDGDKLNTHLYNLEWSFKRKGCRSDQRYEKHVDDNNLPKLHLNGVKEKRVIDDQTRRFKKRFYDGKCHNKYSVEEKLYTIASLYIRNCSCLSITGPNYRRHIRNIFGIISASNVIIPEISTGVVQLLWAEAKKCPFFLNDKVNIIHSDINQIKYYDIPYQDLDLMGTWKSCFNTFENRLIKQMKYSINQYKGLIFTVSERNGGGKTDSFDHINMLVSNLDCELKGFDGEIDGFGKKINISEKTGKLRYIHNQIPDFIHRGRVEQLVVFRYADGPPTMMTGLIIYK